MRPETRTQQMRHTAHAVRGKGLAAIGMALVLAPAGLSSPTRPKAHLRLVDRAPLIVKGSHFRAGERVRITIVASVPASRSVRAARDGSFTARFDAVSVGRCGELAVQALGARGDRAALKVLQQEDCAPGLGP
jgi:hypothetical protein